jgi:hypothetical protein
VVTVLDEVSGVYATGLNVTASGDEIADGLVAVKIVDGVRLVENVLPSLVVSVTSVTVNPLGVM